MEENILICEDSLEGVFSAVYYAYEKHYRFETTSLQVSEEENLRLFASYEHVENDMEKTKKVINCLKRRFGEEAFYILCQALASTEPQKATAVYRTIAKGLLLSRADKVLERYADADVQMVQKLKLSVWHEMHHLFGFLRFREMKGGILFSEIQPKYRVLPYLAEHFSDRFPNERFLIYDSGRELFAVHEAGAPWFLAEASYFEKEKLEESEKEGWYQELFRHFCHTISIEERGNDALQKSMLPLRFRPYMTEFGLH